MKNLFKYVFMLMVVVMGSVAISSCGGDDDDSGSSSSSNPFIGTWIFTPTFDYGRIIEIKEGIAYYYNISPDGQYETVTTGWKRCSNKGSFTYVRNGSTLVTSGGDTYTVSGSTLNIPGQTFTKLK